MAESGDMSEEACDPSNLAAQLTRYCRSDAPTSQCCEPVVASVDLAGGDPSCLCRVLAEPQLAVAGTNATGLLAMYTACGGLRTVGADIADGCNHLRARPATPAAVITAP
uniref:Bifunctional inhibitor/plant lipid transfer protein/seed storage helical domain-containing protein n=2 Tax=Oryza brachyantha TaxID=4533 RepID=J3LRG4_ORYBR